MPLIERVRELLLYDPETGLWVWRVYRGGKAKAGTPAGSLSSEGYVVIGVDGRVYPAHVLAWGYMTGVWPAQQIDHEDTRRANNVWLNLREATPAQNAQNSNAHKDSKTGLRGVSETPTGRFMAQLIVNGERIHIGTFDTKEAAAVARDAVAADRHGAFARFTVLSH